LWLAMGHLAMMTDECRTLGARCRFAAGVAWCLHRATGGGGAGWRWTLVLPGGREGGRWTAVVGVVLVTPRVLTRDYAPHWG
jgi:hypothetical protein